MPHKTYTRTTLNLIIVETVKRWNALNLSPWFLSPWFYLPWHVRICIPKCSCGILSFWNSYSMWAQWCDRFAIVPCPCCALGCYAKKRLVVVWGRFLGVRKYPGSKKGSSIPDNSRVEGCKFPYPYSNGCVFLPKKLVGRNFLNIPVNDFLSLFSRLPGTRLKFSCQVRCITGFWWSQRSAGCSPVRMLSSTLTKSPRSPKCDLATARRWQFFTKVFKSCRVEGDEGLSQQMFWIWSLLLFFFSIFVVVMLQCYWVVFDLFCHFRSI